MQIEHFGDVKSNIKDGDLLLFQKRSLLSVGGLISVGGRGKHSHAAKAVWIRDTLYCMEVREGHGGRLVTLESQVKKFPGRIDVFRSGRNSPDYDRRGATDFMLRFIGIDYGWWNVTLTALTHLPLIRFFFRPSTRDLQEANAMKHPPYCSMAVAMADRIGGGVDPVPNLADRNTEPPDLARSRFYRYRFTLIQ